MESSLVQDHTRCLYTVKQFVSKFPAFTEGGIRQLIFHSVSRNTSKGNIPANGFENVIVRLGRKLLIDENNFFEWLESQQG